MAADIDNIRLGQCDVTYDGTALGLTKGGVEVTIKNDATEVSVDKYGSTPVAAYHKGTRVEVKTTLSEYAYDVLVAVLNGSQKVEGLGGSPVDGMTLGDMAGVELEGALLLLHPSIVVGNDQDVQIWKAIVTGDTKIPFKVDEETTYEVTFLGLIDSGKTTGNYLGQFGTV
jgi:hypothetical protein